MAINIDDKAVETDKEGFLLDLLDWTPDIAELIAQNEGIMLTPAHWEIITVLRRFYHQFQTSPTTRVFSKVLKKELDDEKSKSIYLMQLFKGSPVKIVSKIAGLPRPTNCV